MIYSYTVFSSIAPLCKQRSKMVKYNQNAMHTFSSTLNQTATV